MNSHDVRQLLDRTADEVRPRHPVTGSSIRARAHRQHRQQLAVVAAAAAVVCVVAGVSVWTGGFRNTSAGLTPGSGKHSASPSSPASPNTAASKPATAPKPNLVGKVSMTLPAGWHQQAVGDDFDPCTAQQNTLYVGGAMTGQNSWGQTCKGNVSQPWAWIMDKPVEAGLLTPLVMVLPGGSTGLVESSVKLDDAALAGTPPPGIPPVKPPKWQGDQINVPWAGQAVLIVTDQPSLLKELEAAIQAPVPPLQSLLLPAAAAIADGIAEKLGGPMSGAGAANAAIAADLLRGLPAVPPSAACSFKQEGSVGFDIQIAGGSVKVVISTDPTCLQAVSSAGGRVTVAANTGQRVYDQMNR